MEPLLESARRRPPTKPGHLVGHPIALPHSHVRALIAVDMEGNLHFLLAPPAESPHQFDQFQLRAMEISNRVWAVAGQEATSYLDVSCEAGHYSSLERPFLSFCEDILLDLDEVANPETAVLRTCRRWRRFWTEDHGDNFSIEWLHGLLGELAFLNGLIEDYGPNATRAWTGPEARDHDFQAASALAFEVKTGTSMPLAINCNLRQLDTTIFSKLYLACFLLQKSADGTTLPDLVHSIEGKLEAYEESADLFYTHLSQSGYRRQLESAYAGHAFEIGRPEYFCVDDEFPRITLNSFKHPPDIRIRDIRYKLLLSGIRPIDEDAPEITQARRRLCEEVL